MTSKGHVAAEVTAGDELLVAEMLFGGRLQEATPEQCAAVLSCLVWEEKGLVGVKVGGRGWLGGARAAGWVHGTTEFGFLLGHAGRVELGLRLALLQ